jgi:hypothetical protein
VSRRSLAAVTAAALVAAAVVVVVLVGPLAGSSPKRTHRAAVPTISPALPAPPGEVFGVNVNRLFDDFSYTPAQTDTQLAALRATGATVARGDALWEATEPTAPSDGIHHWTWTFDDLSAGALAAHGLTWLPVLDYSTPWAQSLPGQDHSPPRSAADYAAYARAFAARYGPGGTFWQAHPELAARPVTTIEIWNEPDNAEFWTPAPDPAGYANLYLAARAAIDAVDPSTRVLVGGLVNPSTFLPAMLRAVPGLAGHVDGVAIHPYGTPPVVIDKVRSARATLAAVGMGSVPLYVNEVGWTTSPPGALDYVEAARRPAWIKRTLATLGRLDCGVAAAVLYTWVTPQRHPADSQDWFGIHGPDGAATPSTSAFAAGLRAAAAPGRRVACS